MDQAILRAIVAPAKLAWKSQLGKDLISTYGVDEKNAASFPGAVTAILAVSGELEGRVLFVMTETTAKSVEAAMTSRWDEGLNQRTLDAVKDLLKPVIENVPKLLETGGHTCTVELAGVMDTKGKGIASGNGDAEVIMLASAPDFNNPASKDEISVWVMLESDGSSGDAKAEGDEGADLEETGSDDPPVDETADETAGGGSIGSDPTLTEDEAAILGDLQAEFEDEPETPLFSDDDIAAMMKAEEAMSGEEPDFASSEASTEEEDPSSDEQLDEADEDDSDFGSPRVYPAVEVGVITTEKLEIVDADGKPRTVLSTLRDGSPYLSIADATGRIRATLRLDEEGDARLTFVDEMGAETWMAPRDEPPPAAREPEAPRKRAAPAVAPKKSKSPGPGTNGKKPRPRRDARPARRKLSADGQAPKGPGRRKVKVAAKKPSRRSADRTPASR